MDLQNLIWDAIKPSVEEMYLEQRKTLNQVMAAFESIIGVHSSQVWKAKLKAWDFFKNLPNDHMQWISDKKLERERKGKDTIFFNRKTIITVERIKNFEGGEHSTKRGADEELPRHPKPYYITYHTPCAGNEWSFQETTEVNNLYHKPASEINPTSQLFSTWKQIYSSECTRSTISIQYSEVEDHSDTNNHMYSHIPQTSRTAVVEEFQSATDHPWSPYQMPNEFREQNTTLARHRRILTQLDSAELIQEKHDQNPCPEMCCMEHGSFLEAYLTIDSEPEAIILDTMDAKSLFDITRTLNELYNTYSESTSLFSNQEYELAIFMEEIGNFADSEYHFRRIVDRETDAALANTFGLEASMSQLCSDLTNFIIQFTKNPLHFGSISFQRIEAQFMTLETPREQDWSPLEQCYWQIVFIVDKTISERTATVRTASELLKKGFRFACECLGLNLLKIAKPMYATLLEHAKVELDDSRDGIEHAEAYRDYGMIFGKEENWTLSAEQLLLAFEVMKASGKYPISLLEFLETDLDTALLHLEFQALGTSLFVGKIKGVLVEIRNRRSPCLPSISETMTDEVVFAWGQNMPIRSGGKDKGRILTSNVAWSSTWSSYESHEEGLTRSRSSEASFMVRCY